MVTLQVEEIVSERPILAGHGRNYLRAMASLIRRAKARKPELLSMDLERMINAVASDTNCPSVRVTSLSGLFHLRRRNF